MSRLLEFFDGDAESFGFFYPRDYAVLGFATLEEAREAEMQLEAAGFGERELLLAGGQDVLETYRQIREDAGFWDRFKRALTKSVGTEYDYIQDDIALAEKGGAFLVAYCPTTLESERMRRFAARLKPAIARRYTAMAIEDLS